VRCDTGATGDEAPYENPGNIPGQYQISAADWRTFRLWAFEVFRHAFQDGTNGPVIPLLFQDIEKTGYPIEWDWVTNHVKGGFGGKYGGAVRGHNLNGAADVSDSYREYAVGGGLKIFSRNEMDQTWQNMDMFQKNLRMCMYWCAVEQLHPGLSIWDVSGTCLENASAGGYVSTFEFFNKWSAELDPATAGGGFCIFHDGLDSSDTARFPEALYGTATKSNTDRYLAICATNAINGARMDDPSAVTAGQVYQRNNQIGFNDSAWRDVPGNYERFITQLNPLDTSKGVWRIYGATNGTITSSSHSFDRFARSFDHANGKDAMYFDINNSLVTSPGQQVQLSVIYRDKGTGQFALRYDAVTNSQKTAFTVTKSNSLTWKTNTVVVTDWAFTNSGPNGADLVLTNLGTEDTIFHSIELIKLAYVNVGTVGKGTVSGRTDGTVYSPIMGTFMERQRLELTATPAVGWRFTGWSGDTNDLSGGDIGGTNTRPFLFPRNGCQLTANFEFITGSGGSTTSTDDFTSGTLTGGTGWSGGWTTSGTVVPGVFVELNGTTGNAQITRTLAVPVTNATLSFDWDLDRIGNNEYGAVSVFNGVWQQVWQQTDPGSDAQNAGDANLTNAIINLSAYGSISQIRFTLNAGASNHRFYIDNVIVTGTPAVTATNTQPLFSSDPINKSPATNGVAYAGTLAGDASDPGGKPLTFSMVSGPTWLTVATNGVLSGTPTNTILGLNSWLVRITNGVGGSDDAILLINVSDVPANSPPVFTVKPISRPSAGAGISYSNTLAGSATDVNAGDTLTYSKVSNDTGNTWLNVATNGTLSGTPGAADVGTNSWTVHVSDGHGGTDTATLNIVVLSAYAVWANQFPLSQGPYGDDDGDGFKNLYEFGVGGNPTNSSDHGFLPTFTLKSGGGSNWCEYVHAQRSDPNSGLLYYLQLSDSLVSNVWTTNGYTVVGSGPLTNGFLSVTNRIETDVKSQQFIRLTISGQ